MKLRFAFVKDGDLAHCWVRHLVESGEAIEAWYKGAAAEEPAHGGALKRRAKIKNGRDLTVIWRWLSENRILIITAYDTDMEARYEG